MSGKTMTISETVTVPGISPQARNLVLTSANDVRSEPVGGIPAAKTGQLTTRTNTTDGALTMDAGHGLVTGKIDLFWAGGSRHGVDAVVTVNSLAITGGAGDDLPANLTAITASAPTVEDFTFTGSNAVGALAYSSLGTPPNTGDFDGWVVFTTSGGTVVASFRVTASVPSNSWDGAGVAVNPFAGQSVAKVRLSHGNTAARMLGAVVLYN